MIGCKVSCYYCYFSFNFTIGFSIILSNMQFFFQVRSLRLQFLLIHFMIAHLIQILVSLRERCSMVERDVTVSLLLNHVGKFGNGVRERHHFQLKLVLSGVRVQGAFSDGIKKLGWSLLNNILDVVIFMSGVLRKSCNDILDRSFVVLVESFIAKMPIRNDEFKMISHSCLRSNQRPCREGVTHDSNQHIQHMNNQEESCKCKENSK